MSITITERAAAQVTKQLTKRGKGLGLRLGVKKSGCTGYAYVVDYADDASDSDLIFEQHGVKVVISQDDLPHLNGITVDFRREGISEAFKFDNPNIKAMCGCGESFAV
ncbi:MAG: iron-sulfur cluster assembly accessory protein [Methylococcaceae bacterium]|jgi:iron-sulfur cluster assembly protein|nr:iron-sulfur cluster assembly accessory protein [Methylococcaceae bacterium]